MKPCLCALRIFVLSNEAGRETEEQLGDVRVSGDISVEVECGHADVSRMKMLVLRSGTESEGEARAIALRIRLKMMWE
jgi:hypothetical protein